MNNICIVLNAFYPFNPGETFLANEMEYLSSFDQIFVAPIHGDPLKNQFNYRKKHDVSVIEIPSFSTTNKIAYSSKALFSMDFYREMLVLIKSKQRFTRGYKR